MKPLPHIDGLHAYTPGFQPQGEGWVKLNTNESPYPPSPRVREAIVGALGDDGRSLALYPSPRSEPLRQAVADLHGLGMDQVIIGNGSDDILNLLVRTFVSGDAQAYTWTPSYSLYPVLIDIQEGVLREIPFTRDMQLPVDAVADAAASIVFLTSPNAPTGVAFDNEVIAQLCRRCQGLVVVDEAYADFAEDSALPLLAQYDNLLVTRTFSKSYGLAGLRVGYAVAAARVIDYLDRVRDSYNVDRLAQVGALAALQDQSYLQSCVQRVQQTRTGVMQRCQDLAWFAYPSQANFVFMEPVNARGESGVTVAESLFEFLKKEKILVRFFKQPDLCSSFLRVSIGTDAQMERFFDVVTQWKNHA